MPDVSDSDSILGELDKTLDDLFGKDQGESMPAEGMPVSPLEKLRGVMRTINEEICQESISALKTEVKHLQSSYPGDTQVLALLKIMSLLVGYMKLNKPDAHQETTTLLNSAFQCMERVVEDQSISTHEKIALISKEIEHFNKFKAKTSTGEEPSRKKAVSRTRETGAGDSEPPSGAVPSSTTVPAGEIFTALDNLRSYLGEELAALKSRVDGLKEEFTRSDDARAHMIEESAALKGQMQQLRGLSEDLDNVRAQLAQEIIRLKGHVDDIKGEMSRFRDDLLIARSELEGIRDVARHGSGAPGSDESAGDEAEIVEVEEVPENPEVTDLDLLERDSLAEGASSLDEPQERQIHGDPTTKNVQSKYWEESAFDSGPEEIEPRKSSPSSESYFFFQMGGKSYAVGGENVIKASKADRRLLKKASEKGELSMIDCKRVFSGIKRGIEPAWNHLSSKELEKTTFRLLTDDRIDGLLDTDGGGMLFLGAGGERSILFTDQLPKKKPLSRKDRVKPLCGLDYVCGAIRKSDDSADSYLILDAHQLCKRLRACIPAPFTKT
ncbi:MAG: hypothetical protein JSV55_12545 [Deltaproteobacteria bacterium]|nr:MAG: hypothetical protein JSV55_12545 [Deltaproteobacteria bacterium]